MSLRYLLRIDWDVVAGIIAALVAMLLSFMGLVSETVGRGIILLLSALLLIRDLRGEAREHRMFDKLDMIIRQVNHLKAASHADIHLIGPKTMRKDLLAFATTIYGDVTWFNVCCRMFRRQDVFNATLRPFLDNPHVTSLQLLCRPEERPYWLSDLLPKLRSCPHGDKVRPPLWGPIHTDVSFMLGDVDGDGRDEAMLSVLEEPFATTGTEPNVPRYLVRVFSHSELMVPLEEIARRATGTFTADGEVTDAASPPARPRSPETPPAA